LLLHVGEFGILGVSLRKRWTRDTPVDCESGVVPKNAVLVRRSIVITAFVKKLNRVRQGQKAVSKTCRDIHLVLFLRGEADARPFAKMWRADANVHRDVQSFAFDDATELGLGMLQLIVKAAEGSAEME